MTIITKIINSLDNIFNTPKCVSLRVGQWVFAPSWLPTCLFLIFFSLLVALGFWQLSRAIAKQQLIDQYASRILTPPRYLTEHESTYNPIKITGYYDNEHTIFVDNRFFNHQVGYYIISPFIDPTHQRMLLVNRGWVARSNHYGSLPPLERVSGEQTIIGLVQIPQSDFVLSHTKFSSWPWLVEDVQLNVISKALGKPIYPFIVLLSPSLPNGFTRHWELITAIPPQRHRAYAVQWFILALTLGIIYVKLNFYRYPHE